MRNLIVLALLGGLAGCANMGSNSCCQKGCGKDMARHEKHEEDEGKEQKVAFSSIPQPAQATLNKESGGASIDQVDKEDHHGKTIYEADAKMNGKNYEIKVDADGTLLSKKLDMEDEGHEHMDKDMDHHKDKDGDKDEANEKNEMK